MSDAPTKEQWAAVRELLKGALLSGFIPVEPTAFKPKDVWKHYTEIGNGDIKCIHYDNKSVRDKFTRLLRSLRTKHRDGDLENEGRPGEKPIEWGKSVAKRFLKKWFREKVISPDYASADQVWRDHCQGHYAFARLQNNDAFKRRLAYLREDHLKRVDRCKKDLEAYTIAKANHPTPALNSRGEPQWNGSPAQASLKEVVKRGEHKGVAPSTLHKSKEEYQVYSLRSFRDHIYQEERLLKFQNWIESVKQAKEEKLQY